jgi:hypothetical protein
MCFVFLYCVLYCLYCVFCIVSFMYIYSYMFCLYQCKDYCHRVTTQLQIIIIIIIIIVIVIIINNLDSPRSAQTIPKRSS